MNMIFEKNLMVLMSSDVRTPYGLLYRLPAWLSVSFWKKERENGNYVYSFGIHWIHISIDWIRNVKCL